MLQNQCLRTVGIPGAIVALAVLTLAPFQRSALAREAGTSCIDPTGAFGAALPFDATPRTLRATASPDLFDVVSQRTESSKAVELVAFRVTQEKSLDIGFSGLTKLAKDRGLEELSASLVVGEATDALGRGAWVVALVLDGDAIDESGIAVRGFSPLQRVESEHQGREVAGTLLAAIGHYARLSRARAPEPAPDSIPLGPTSHLHGGSYDPLCDRNCRTKWLSAQLRCQGIYVACAGVLLLRLNACAGSCALAGGAPPAFLACLASCVGVNGILALSCWVGREICLAYAEGDYEECIDYQLLFCQGEPDPPINPL